jgi:hypothetical protein
MFSLVASITRFEFYMHYMSTINYIDTALSLTNGCVLEPRQRLALPMFCLFCYCCHCFVFGE